MWTHPILSAQCTAMQNILTKSCHITGKLPFLGSSQVGSSQLSTVRPHLLRHSSSASTACRDTVRKADHDAFICSLFAPEAVRRKLWCIRAFNIETSRIKDEVSEPQIGKIKLLWWKEMIDTVYGVGDSSATASTPVLSHPVAQELLYYQKQLLQPNSLENTKLASSWFKRILTERSADLNNNSYSNLEELESYCENTASSLLYLTAEAFGIQSVQADLCASHLGKAIGLTTILRATPFHLSKRHSYLPLDLMASHGISQEDFYRNGPKCSGNYQDLIFDVATRANDHVLTARHHAKEWQATGNAPPALQHLFLFSYPSQQYLERLEEVDFNVFEPGLQRKEWRMPLRIWSYATSGRP